MIRFTFHVECGPRGLIFGMEQPIANNPHPAEEAVVHLVADLAREAVSKWSVKTVKELGGDDLSILDFDGPNSQQMSEPIRNHIRGHDDQEK